MNMRKLIQRKGTVGTSPKDYRISGNIKSKNDLLCRHLYFAGVWVDEDSNFWIQDGRDSIEIDRSILFGEEFFEGHSIESFFTEGGAVATCITMNGVKTYTFVDKFESVMFKL